MCGPGSLYGVAYRNCGSVIEEVVGTTYPVIESRPSKLKYT